uniref:RNase III domain-containing protein n=1 Tax=Globodera pallida TaxID=36090 RepID=A0A183BVP1_GLOPA
MEKCEEISDDEPSTSTRAEATLNTGECSFSAASDSVSHNKKSEELEFTGAIDWADNEVDQCHFPNPLEAVGGSGVTESDDGRNGIGESPFWTQSITPGKFYRRNRTSGQFGTSALHALHNEFETKAIRILIIWTLMVRPQAIGRLRNRTKSTKKRIAGIGENGGMGSEKVTNVHPLHQIRVADPRRNHRWHRKRDHPAALHPDIGFNESGQLNDGPLCKCSWTAKQSGIRHDKFVGEQSLTKCQWNSSSIECLHHYVLVVQPTPSAFSRRPTAIQLDGHCYEFDGFSILLHRPLPEHFSQTPINQWTNDFQLRLVKENMPESFTIRDLELFHAFLFEDLLELYDLNRFSTNYSVDGETQDEDGKELLPMSTVLAHFAREFSPLLNDQMANAFCRNKSALVEFALQKKGQICRPMAIRMDMIDAHSLDGTNRDFYPLLVHFGVKPTAYAFSKRYQDALKKHIKIRKTMLTGRNNNVLTSEEKRTLRASEANLQQLKQECVTRRDTTILVNSRGFYSTGLYPDIVQHSLLLVLMCHHIRFHCSLGMLEKERLEYVFKNRALLELALIHPSFRANYGTNSDHAKNTINNCGLRMGKGTLKRKGREQQTVGAIHGAIPQLSTTNSVQQQSTRKRGIQALMEIMSIQGSQQVTESPLRHNERLEFLGDAVVEFLTTIHLFFLFSDLDEGGLATFRSALLTDSSFTNLWFTPTAPTFAMRPIYGTQWQMPLKLLWPPYFWIQIWRNATGSFQILLADFEESIGIRFKHIRLLAKAFTRRNVPYNYLTLGNNQRLEFLGDTVLQLLTTEYIYKHFPHHQEGHLSLLRTCLVSNKTQSFVCDELAMTRYLVIPEALLRKGTLAQLRLKDKADLNEAFIGALYVDRGLIYCRQFCRTCFFPRLKYFIMTQRWNDPKSQLQQCCLALREGGNGDPDIPEYKTIGVEAVRNAKNFESSWNSTPKFINTELHPRHGQKRSRGEENGDEPFSHPNVKKRTVSLVLERSNDSTGKGLKDKSYWTPRLEAIQQALQKSRQQNAGIVTVHHKWDSTQSKKSIALSVDEPVQQRVGSHFFFNNTPTRYRSKASVVEDNGSQMGEANSPLLLPPPPPPPKLLPPPPPPFDTEI